MPIWLKPCHRARAFRWYVKYNELGITEQKAKTKTHWNMVGVKWKELKVCMSQQCKWTNLKRVTNKVKRSIIWLTSGMCELHLTELLTLTILDGLPLSGPLQKISNKKIQLRNYAEVTTQEHAAHKIRLECHQEWWFYNNKQSRYMKTFVNNSLL